VFARGDNQSNVDDLAAAYVAAVAPVRVALREYRTRVGSLELTVVSLTDLASAARPLAAAMKVAYAFVGAIAWPDDLRPLVDPVTAAGADWLELLDGVSELKSVRDASAWIDDAHKARVRSVDAGNLLRAALGLPAFALPKLVER
jgi:hypothetical protein